VYKNVLRSLIIKDLLSFHVAVANLTITGASVKQNCCASIVLYILCRSLTTCHVIFSNNYY